VLTSLTKTVIFGKRAIAVITITTRCRLFWTFGKINDFQLKGQKFKRTETHEVNVILSLSSFIGRQEQTSGWVLTEFLKGYRAKRKIPIPDSCTRHTLPYIVLTLSTEGAKNTFNTLSTNRSVILF